uniref:Uncharacterized protein n=1 Tax=Lactuca sativa TaxID=4236 RepID=A0A9R1UJA5_LACSA|nr:hypothetical protein LSAT_V11C900490080 [Lactuca sativa]
MSKICWRSKTNLFDLNQDPDRHSMYSFREPLMFNSIFNPEQPMYNLYFKQEQLIKDSPSTCFTLWLGPQDISTHRVIVIALVRGDHYVNVDLQRTYLMPTICHFGVTTDHHGLLDGKLSMLLY